MMKAVALLFLFGTAASHTTSCPSADESCAPDNDEVSMLVVNQVKKVVAAEIPSASSMPHAGVSDHKGNSEEETVSAKLLEEEDEDDISPIHGCAKACPRTEKAMTCAMISQQIAEGGCAYTCEWSEKKKRQDAICGASGSDSALTETKGEAKVLLTNSVSARQTWGYSPAPYPGGRQRSPYAGSRSQPEVPSALSMADAGVSIHECAKACPRTEKALTCAEISQQIAEGGCAYTCEWSEKKMRQDAICGASGSDSALTATKAEAKVLLTNSVSARQTWGYSPR